MRGGGSRLSSFGRATTNDARPKQLRTFRRTCGRRAPRAWRCAKWPASCWKERRRGGGLRGGERKGGANVLFSLFFSFGFESESLISIVLSSRICDERLSSPHSFFFLLLHFSIQCPPPSSRVSRAGAPPATARRRSRPEAPSSSSSSELRRRRGGAPLLLGAPAILFCRRRRRKQASRSRHRQCRGSRDRRRRSRSPQGPPRLPVRRGRRRGRARLCGEGGRKRRRRGAVQVEAGASSFFFLSFHLFPTMFFSLSLLDPVSRSPPRHSPRLTPNPSFVALATPTKMLSPAGGRRQRGRRPRGMAPRTRRERLGVGRRQRRDGPLDPPPPPVPGVYAIFDADFSLQHVGYARDAVRAVRAAREAVGGDRARSIRARLFAPGRGRMVGRAELSGLAAAWLAEGAAAAPAGSAPPPGNTSAEAALWAGGGGGVAAAPSSSEGLFLRSLLVFFRRRRERRRRRRRARDRRPRHDAGPGRPPRRAQGEAREGNGRQEEGGRAEGRGRRERQR